jgi:fused signal recognition particle receptor
MFSMFKPKPAPEMPVAATPVLVEPAAPDAAAKASWGARLKAGLSKTRAQLGSLFTGIKVDETLFEDLESALISADCGVPAAQTLIARLRERAKQGKIEDGETLKAALADVIAEMLQPLEKPLDLDRAKPLVMMISGVNGVGKTTSIGKLAKYFQSRGKSVLLAAGDTFRAAAREQLTTWGERNNVAVIAQESGDAAAVIFDSVAAARARGVDILMADTAGRLPTQLNLMEEIKKVKRVIAKADATAPHEVLLVIDANTGQNAVAQVKAFDDAIGLTGLVVTKLDGTAKGGVLCAIASARARPVYFIGVGESIEDLRPFVARDYARAMLGLD